MSSFYLIICFLFFFLLDIVRVERGNLRPFLGVDLREILAAKRSISQHRGGFLKSPSSADKRDEERVKIERTFVAIKPDGVERRLIGEIIARLERKGMSIVAMKMLRPSLDLVEKHYEMHRGKSFFADLISFFSSGPIVAMVCEGNYAIDLTRSLIGATHPENALPGTIRGDFCYQRGRTLVHSSDSVESAAREIDLWFRAEEIVSKSSQSSTP